MLRTEFEFKRKLGLYRSKNNVKSKIKYKKIMRQRVAAIEYKRKLFRFYLLDKYGISQNIYQQCKRKFE